MTIINKRISTPVTATLRATRRWGLGIVVFMSLPLAGMAGAKKTSQPALTSRQVNITNLDPAPLRDYLVTLDVSKDRQEYRALRVTVDGQEVASQIDDYDQDGTTDALSFLVDLPAKGRAKAMLQYASDTTALRPAVYPVKTYAQLMLRNEKIKAKNKHDFYLQSITTGPDANTYTMLHEHGVAFESELIGLRIYFDARQTIDLYGKRYRQLELRQTQFYPDESQKAAGMGDDVLFVGNSVGLGGLRGWNGRTQTFATNVRRRTQRIIANGPVATIVEVENRGWRQPGFEPVTVVQRYTIVAGHRDVRVDVTLDRPVRDLRFLTGLTHVRGSKEISDGRGLRACWGTDWPVAERDSAGWQRETIGMAIYIPGRYIDRELLADTDNYGFVVRPIRRSLTYYVAACSAREENGPHSAEEWFDHVGQWAETCRARVRIEYK